MLFLFQDDASIGRILMGFFQIMFDYVFNFLSLSVSRADLYLFVTRVGQFLALYLKFGFVLQLRDKTLSILDST